MSWFGFGSSSSSAAAAGLILPELETPKTDAERSDFVRRNLEQGRAMAGRGDWQVVEQPDASVTICELPLEPGKAIPAMKVEGFVAATPEQVVELLFSTDLSLVHKFDETCAEIQELERFGDGGVVARRVNQAPFPMSNREVVALRAVVKDSDSGRIEVVVSSINVDSVPEASGTVRAIMWAYLLIEPRDGGSQFMRVGTFDPRGNIPAFVVALGKTKMAEFLPKFRKALL